MNQVWNIFSLDVATLEANKDRMRCKMEMMLMTIQKNFCRALENEEDPRLVGLSVTFGGLSFNIIIF